MDNFNYSMRKYEVLKKLMYKEGFNKLIIFSTHKMYMHIQDKGGSH